MQKQVDHRVSCGPKLKVIDAAVLLNVTILKNVLKFLWPLTVFKF